MSRLSVRLPAAGNLSPEFALLGFLVAGPQHGYDLHRRFQAELGQVWHLSQSQAYAILKRLERNGSISSHMIEQEKLPPKQVLRITAAGRRRFNEWLESRVSGNARSIRLEFLTRLYFVRRYKPERTEAIYEAQKAEVQARIERLQALLCGIPAGQVFNRLSLDLRLRQMQLILSWIDEMRTEMLQPETIQ